MTKIIDGIRVRTYDEWIKIPEVKELEELIEECPMCDGEGVHLCDCGNEHDCEECEGRGKADDLKHMYNKELKHELEKLLKWTDALRQNA